MKSILSAPRFLAFLAAFAAFATQTATASFLGDLATNANKVVSSPYATGGDVILHLQGAGYSDYVHVFTGTAAATTFTPSANFRARVLVVAGGGAAGSVTQNPGGGGAGGMIEEFGVALAAGTDYTVTVGAGGAVVGSQNGNKNGDNSSFVGGSVSMTAIGGGRGSDYGANKANPGGSGGGAGSDKSLASGGAGTPGQGHDGGSVLASPYNVGGGGGGGAGAHGGTVCIYSAESPLGAIHGGIGGDGLPSDILGFEQYFAGGGGGYYDKAAADGCIRSPGGLGGGGSGGLKGDTAGGNGEDGLGGGGGGGKAGTASGRGGSGIVVVRYVVWTSTVPLLRESTAEAKGGSFVTVVGALGAFGAGESSATVKMRYWKTSNPSAISIATIIALSGDDMLDATFEKHVGGFDADTEYGYALYAEGAGGTSSEFTGTFTTFSDSIGSGTSGGTASVVDSVDRVHVFTENGTFTATGSGYAEILVVGGGGAGGTGAGPGGGGGGGGVVHVSKAFLASGTYTVTVGAGGTMNGSTVAYIESAGNSSFALASGPAGFSFETITAYGGGNGIGWDANNNATSIAKACGASGGGASRNANKGSMATAIYGQGHLGGDIGDDYRPGGGGGAGGNGANGTASGVTPSSAGVGGAGLAYSITGTSVVYGSGGGGGARNNADVMAPGGENGGNGAYWSVAATAGVNGTGGGGGGGCNASAALRQSGAGGSGVVIVRYTDFTLAGDAPILAVHEGEATISCNVIRLPLDVTSAGSGASSVTLTATWRYVGDASELGSQTLSDFIGDAVLDIPINPGRAYAVTVSIDNGQPDGTAEWTGTLESAPMFSEALSYTAAGGVLGFTVDGAAAADSQRLELWVGADAASMTNQATYTDASLLSVGSHTIQPFAVEQFGTDASILIRHVAVVGGHAFTNETAVLSMTITDGATYTWKDTVADGLWCDSANWTASVAGGRGWPTSGSIAKFPNMTATARIDRSVTVAQTQFTANGAVTLLGTVAGATLTTGLKGDAGAFPAGNWTLDALAVVRDPASGIMMNTVESLVLTNGASFTNYNQDFVINNGATLTVASGSMLFASKVGGVGLEGGDHPKLVIDGGAVTSSGEVNLSRYGKVGQPSLDLVIAGPNSRVSVGGAFYSQSTNATVTIELASATYSTTDALVKATGGNTKMANSGYTLTFEVPLSKVSKKCPRCDIMVADWSRSSINTSLVAFGEHEENADCYFFYTTDADPSGTRYRSAAEVTAAGATVKYLWYHHHASPGFVLIVR